jgi:predicted lipid-binding transport protein (Tim44 family)
MEEQVGSQMLNGIVMMPALIGGLIGTLGALGTPIFIALIVTKVNVKASLAAFVMWSGFLGAAMYVALGSMTHAFNAALAYMMISSIIIVPVLAFVLSHIWPFIKPEDPENPADYVFGTPTSEESEQPDTARPAKAMPT